MEKTQKILIVVSTEKEVFELEKKFKYLKTINSCLTSYRHDDLNIDILISGVGVPSTMYYLTKTLMEHAYDLIINIGICGSFSEDLTIGDPVSVILDEFADLGMTYPNNSFKTLFEEEFIKPDDSPYKNGKLFNQFQQFIDTELPKVTSITVNSVSGSRKQIKMRREKFDPDIETMEGAAVAYVCLSENINYLQIRTISNMVEPRNRANWDMPLALISLSETLETVLNNINKQMN